MARPNVAFLYRWRDTVLSEKGPSDAGARLVGLAIAKFLNLETMNTFVGAERLAVVTAFSEKTVRKHLTLLLREGWIASTRKGRGYDWELRLFKLTFPAQAMEKTSTACDSSHTPGWQSAADRAPEEISRAMEEKGLSAGKKGIERWKNLPTNSGSLNTEEELSSVTRVFQMDSRRTEPKPNPIEITKKIRKALKFDPTMSSEEVARMTGLPLDDVTRERALVV